MERLELRRAGPTTGAEMTIRTTAAGRGPVHGPQTNNRAEYQAAAEAVETAYSRGMDNVTVRTDSHLVCDTMNKGWVEKWRDNGWNTSSGGDVKNRDLVERLDSYRDQMDVRFEYVPGHAGVRGNERAGRMAREAANEASTSRGGGNNGDYNNHRGYQASTSRGGGNYYNNNRGYKGSTSRVGGNYYNNDRGYLGSDYNGGNNYDEYRRY
ncbi:hypothetical protein PENTCL1PPCAC_5634 [Pristionchus entomophagus]|uniref:ribonuclease H n=1 Tax=Pristionchus entomophagus TaxID=358040 RepID=A0AAV5SQ66_9BILA|nr:hypothetical protein PENTCL1PPCAC_5634 [Pristionchus entomophagus]